MPDPTGHAFVACAGGNILAHIKASQPSYQVAVFRIIMEWDKAGRSPPKRATTIF
jgi:hypothetical protein